MGDKATAKATASAPKPSKSTWAALAAQAARPTKPSASKAPVRKKTETKKESKKTAAKTGDKSKDGSKSSKPAPKKKPVKVKSAPRPTGAKRIHSATMQLNMVNPPPEPRRRRGWEKAETTAATKAKLAELAAAQTKPEKKVQEDETAEKGKKTAVDKRTDKRKHGGSKRRQNSPRVDAKSDAKAAESRATMGDSVPRPPPAKWGAKKSFASVLKVQSPTRSSSKPTATRESL